MKRRALLAFSLFVAAGNARALEHTDVGTARLLDADKEAANWLTYGRRLRRTALQPARQINAANAAAAGARLVLELDIDRGTEATPLVVDGVHVHDRAWSNVYALDARTGKLLWQLRPEGAAGDRACNACCDVVNRGVAVWEGKVYVGTLDGRLIALDAATGKPVWAHADRRPVDSAYTITGAPRVVKGKVIIGNGGAEFGVRGYVSAYDAETGSQAWRFYTVPGDPPKPFENAAMAMAAAKTWHGDSGGSGGGGTVWDSIAYDPELEPALHRHRQRLAVESRDLRSPGGGDNLFLSSIVALKPDTGEYVWHYQTTPGRELGLHRDAADDRSPTSTIDGEPRKVLMQAPKNGFFYVLDRTTGKLISANNFVHDGQLGDAHRLATGRPVENPENAVRRSQRQGR